MRRTPACDKRFERQRSPHLRIARSIRARSGSRIAYLRPFASNSHKWLSSHPIAAWMTRCTSLRLIAVRTATRRQISGSMPCKLNAENRDFVRAGHEISVRPSGPQCNRRAEEEPPLSRPAIQHPSEQSIYRRWRIAQRHVLRTPATRKATLPALPPLLGNSQSKNDNADFVRRTANTAAISSCDPSRHDRNFYRLA